MKRATLATVLSLIESIDTPEAEAARAEITAELAKGEEQKKANEALYAQVEPIILTALKTAKAPVTLVELYGEVEDKLPEGFSKGKVQYALTHGLKDKVKVTPGKVNSYSVE
jgi:hypothetical protein